MLIKDEPVGKKRLWGAVGYGVSTAISGILVNHMGLSIAFIIFLVSSILAVAFSGKLDMTALTSSGPECNAEDGVIQEDHMQHIVRYM